jgi:HPt (histidine-containing phosphotransfer) domain-containing protein
MVDDRDPPMAGVGDGEDTPFDAAILGRQTGGNRELEHDVLRLFLESCRADIGQLKAAKTAEERRRIAHRLLGAAGAVGALRVARLAASVERSDAQVIPDLEAATAEATEKSTQYLAQ